MITDKVFLQMRQQILQFTIISRFIDFPSESTATLRVTIN